MMSTTTSSSVVLLVLTAAVSLVAAYKVQTNSDRSLDEEKSSHFSKRTPPVSPLLSSVVDNPDYQLGVRYDEYPLIVPKKRTALLVNRLMLALKEAMSEQDKLSDPLVNIDGVNFDTHKSYLISPEDVRSLRSRSSTVQKSNSNNDFQSALCEKYRQIDDVLLASFSDYRMEYLNW